jgi:hypothetical protein
MREPIGEDKRSWYYVTAAAIFGYAIWLRFSLPLTPICDPDTWGYLSPAIDKLSGSGFTHNFRNYFYPGLLFLILRCFADFRAVTVIQHCLGLAGGAVLLATWRRIWFFMPDSRLPSPVFAAAGLTLTASFLFAPAPIAFETNMRPESIASFLVILNIFIALEFWYRGFIQRPPKLSVALGVGAVTSAVAVSLAKPSSRWRFSLRSRR